MILRKINGEYKTTVEAVEYDPYACEYRKKNECCQAALRRFNAKKVICC